MKRFLLLYVIITALNLLIASNSDAASDEKKEVKVVYFYINPCSACDEARKLMDNMDEFGEPEHIDIKYEMYNTYHLSSYNLLHEYFSAYNVPENAQKIPIVFVGNVFLSGEQEIKTRLKGEILKAQNIVSVPQPGEDSEKLFNMFKKMNVCNVFLVALINSLNPCSISMLLFFISILINKNVSILKTGMSYCAGRFIMYICMGTFLFYIFIMLDIGWYKSLVKVVLLAFIGLLILANLWDSFAVRRERYNKIILQLPVSFRKTNHNLIKKLSGIVQGRNMILISFIIGGLISLGEFLCTGQIYLATILFMLRTWSSFTIQAFLYLVIYSFTINIPLILITVLVHKGKEIFNISEVIRSKMSLIKLLNILLFVLFGIWVVFYF